MTEEQLIRQFLFQAEAEEFRSMADALPEPPPFSAAYQRWEKRFLRKPFSYSRRRMRPAWLKTLRSVACFLVVASLSLAAVMSASPQARALAARWFAQNFSTHVSYRFEGQVPLENLRDWAPTYLPEGYTQTEVIDLKAMVNILYNNEDPEMEIEFSYQLISEGGSEQLDNERHIVTTVSVNDMPGQLFTATDDSQNMLIWFDEANDHTFLILSRLDCDTLIRIAESVEPVE